MSLSNDSWLDKRPIPRSKSGDVGIELEIEGSLHLGPRLSEFWAAKEEGSLRGGYEFVLKKPIPMKSLPEALEHLKETLDQSELLPSIRCSTHVHVNVSKMTNRQIYQALGYYFLVEDLLVRTQGPLRMGNLFCLRMSDAENIAYDILRSIRSEHGFNSFNMDMHKYGAINLAAVRRFGSLEFRFLRPLAPEGISYWSNLFHRMVSKAADIPIRKMLDLLEAQQYRELLELAFTQEEISKITEGTTPWQFLLEVNAEYVFDMMKALEEEKKFSLPPGTYEDSFDAPSAPTADPFESEEFVEEWYEDDTE